MRERWTGFRNRLLADPAFQRAAGRFWPTRWIARRRAARLFDLTAGFVYSQTLLVWVESGLLEALADCARTESELAAACGVDQAKLQPFLVAGDALGLGERLADGRWVLGSEGAALRGNPSVLAMIRHHHLLYADLADPKPLLERGGGGGALANYWPYASGREGEAARYSQLMAASQPMIAAQILDAYDFGRHRRVLDIGGGEGAFLEAVAARHPKLSLELFDLPEVAERAKARLGERVQVYAGSFRADPNPQGADLVTLVRILHDHDDNVVCELLTRLHERMTPGATLLIAEPMADDAGVAAYFSLYLLAMGSGRPRSAVELGAMLRDAGFTEVRSRRTAIPLVCSVITGERK